MAARSPIRHSLRSRRAGLIERWALRLAAMLLAAGLSLAFPQPALWWVGWIGLAPVVALLAISPDRAEALKRSWFAGVGYLTALHYWVIPHTGMFSVILAAFVGLFWLPTGLVCWWGLGKHAGPARRWAGIAVVPAVWVILESIRSWEYLGGTWGLLGLSQWRVPLIVQGAALGGVWLLSFVLVAVNVAVVAAGLPGPPSSSRVAYLVVAVLLPVMLAVYGIGRPDVTATGSIAIGGVQPGVFDSGEERLEAHVAETVSLAHAEVDLVVWGQTSVAFDPSRHPELDQLLRSISEMVDADLFVNVDARSDEGIVKTTVQYTADGPVAAYGKQRLVPFGEYIPLRPLFGWVANFTEAARQDRVRGQGLSVMGSAGINLGPLISYESTFPDMRRDLARLGADVTVVQGGTQTFQGTWAQPQQASYEAVNAVASGRPAVLVAVSGVSAAFDGRGRLLIWHSSDWTGAFVVDVPLAKEETFYVRFGDWVIWLSVIVLGVALLVQAMGRVAGRVDETQGSRLR